MNPGRTECRYELPLPIAEDRDGILIDIRKRSPRNCAPSVARVRGGHKRKEIEHLTSSEALAERLTQGIVSAATLRGMANRKRASSASGRQTAPRRRIGGETWQTDVSARISLALAVFPPSIRVRRMWFKADPAKGVMNIYEMNAEHNREKVSSGP